MKEEREVFITCSTEIEGFRKTYQVKQSVVKRMAEMYKADPSKYSAPNGRDLLMAATEAEKSEKEN